MEILGLVLLWPLLILVIGLVFLSATSTAGGFIVLPLIVVFLIFAFGLKDQLGATKSMVPGEELDQTRRGVVAFSIALFLPIFVKYLLSVSGGDLLAMILGLIFGFGILIWGMFIKDNHVLAYANVTGGVFTVIYLYFQLWSLGQLAQVVATAFGLVVAVAVSIIKFRDKLA